MGTAPQEEWAQVTRQEGMSGFGTSHNFVKIPLAAKVLGHCYGVLMKPKETNLAVLGHIFYPIQ